MFAPRFFACSISSSTIIPAPSLSTNPSRSLSHGRLAFSGASLRVDSALAAQKPPSPTGDVDISAPPTSITSAWLLAIILLAKPILCVPVVQAVTTAMFGPHRPNRIDRFPAIMLMIDPGTKNGETFRGPDSFICRLVSSMVFIPPIPDPIATPALSLLIKETSRPASSKASTPAAIPYCMKSSMRLASLVAMNLLQSKFLMAPPKRVLKALTSKWSKSDMPLFPFLIASQEVLTSLPKGVNKPKPVTTTRLLLKLVSYLNCNRLNKQKPP